MRRAVQQLRVVGSALALVALTGCAAHRPRTTGDAAVPLEAFMAQVREATLAARPARANDAATIEKTDPELMAARLALAVSPTADSHRRVAEAYARLGVRDAAYDHFTIAIRLNPRDASA